MVPKALEELKERQGPHTWGSSLIGEEDSWGCVRFGDYQRKGYN